MKKIKQIQSNESNLEKRINSSNMICTNRYVDGTGKGSILAGHKQKYRKLTKPKERSNKIRRKKRKKKKK